MKHDPKPLIEEHYHIQELIDGQEKRTADRNYHRNRQKDLEEREDLIKDSKFICMTDFYCAECKQDFKSIVTRQIETDWTNATQRIAFYKTKCDRGHWCIRLITDRHKDAFFTKSKLMATDRRNHIEDIIQPHETNFNLLYGKK